MKLESCNFVNLSMDAQAAARSWHACGTAVGGKSDCGGEGRDSNRRRRRRGGGREGDGLPRLGLRRLRGRDELVGQDGIKKCEFSRNCLWSFESLKRTQIA